MECKFKNAPNEIGHRNVHEENEYENMYVNNFSKLENIYNLKFIAAFNIYILINFSMSNHEPVSCIEKCR